MRVIKMLEEAYEKAGGNFNEYIELVTEIAVKGTFTIREVKEAEHKLWEEEVKKTKEWFRYLNVGFLSIVLTLCGSGLVFLGNNYGNMPLALLGVGFFFLGMFWFLYTRVRSKRIEEINEIDKKAAIKTGLRILREYRSMTGFQSLN